MTNAELIAKIKDFANEQKELLNGFELQSDFRRGETAAYSAIISFLSTLESEKPMNQDLEKELARFYLKDLCGSEKDEIPEATLHHNFPIMWDDLRDIARHFAEWGYLRAAEKYNEIEYNRQRAEESVPKDLEEAAEISFDEAYALTEDYRDFLAKGLTENKPRPIGPHWFCEYAKKRFIAGAKWQKEQLMKDAVESTVMDFSSNQPRPQVDVLLDPHKYHTGDKVRIIIVKEDEK